mmetsp:Transcript_3703/g.4040  ORF Transcript_3703/g.4040 Transcript_3703/m.4040 type:complete len:97 (-) Transcript_3703:203-493(-)
MLVVMILVLLRICHGIGHLSDSFDATAMVAWGQGPGYAELEGDSRYNPFQAVVKKKSALLPLLHPSSCCCEQVTGTVIRFTATGLLIVKKQKSLDR